MKKNFDILANSLNYIDSPKAYKEGFDALAEIKEEYKKLLRDMMIRAALKEFYY